MNTLVELFDHAVSAWPRSLAVEGPDGRVTYSELDALIASMATALRERGVREGDRIGLWLEKSVSGVAATQAALRLGATYVPLDPLSPRARIVSIVSDCEMGALVTTVDRAAALDGDLGACPLLAVDATSLERTRAQCPGGTSGHNRVARRPTDLAYILYTSGSTGTPKGVCISHRNAVAFVEWAAAAIGAKSDDRLANHAPFHFDLSVFDIYVAFRCGGSVHLVPEGTSYAPQRLVDFVASREITVLYVVPSVLVMMQDGSDFLRRSELALRTIVFAGEPFPIRPLRALRDAFPAVALWNFYGPTETNVCTAFEVKTIEQQRIHPVPIGGAVSGDRVWAVRPDGEIASIGEEGELYVDGPTVMLGYWGKERQAGKPYATGDLVRVLPSGEFEYIGRRDHMVKVRGHRIELGEIEAVLQTHAAIKEAVALVVGEGLHARICAVVVARGPSPALLDLKRHCAERLPRYMIVDDITVVKELPRTRNGKVDRAALAVLARA
jgi:amino acid adenylation domain-containing protein